MADETGQEPAIAEATPEVSAETDVNALAEGSGSAPDAEKPAEPAPKDKVQERFDKITREKYDALRRADQLEYRLRELEEREAKAKAQPVAPVTAPTLESVGYDEAKYAAAMREFARQEARSEAKAVLEERQRQQSEAERASAFEKRQAEVMAKRPDYAEKVFNDRLPISAAMAEAIRESDIGPEVAYWLANNADRALEISQKSPTAAAREIGRIEALIEAESKVQAAKPVSQAPPPPPRIEATEAVTRIELGSPEAEKLSDAEWGRRRNLQLQRKRDNRQGA